MIGQISINNFYYSTSVKYTAINFSISPMLYCWHWQNLYICERITSPSTSPIERVYFALTLHFVKLVQQIHTGAKANILSKQKARTK